MSQINKVLDDYYAPIKLPDNNRDGLKADLHKAIMGVMPETKKPRSKTTGIRTDGYGGTYIDNNRADIDIYLPEDDAYNSALKDVEQAINELFGGSDV